MKKSIEHTFTYQREAKLRRRKLLRGAAVVCLVSLPICAFYAGPDLYDTPEIWSANEMRVAALLKEISGATSDYAKAHNGACPESIAELAGMEAVPEGIAAADRSVMGEKAVPFWGYYFVMIKKRGGENLSPGQVYGICAFPAFYGESGINTTYASPAGEILIKDLNGAAPQTDANFFEDGSWNLL
ncbi:MAG: hypothetical protein JXR97_02770 [Planctomycetes bacterium]|nr:hypothetical protein [Planctomycetota bacterium]